MGGGGKKENDLSAETKERGGNVLKNARILRSGKGVEIFLISWKNRGQIPQRKKRGGGDVLKLSFKPAVTTSSSVW